MDEVIPCAPHRTLAPKNTAKDDDTTRLVEPLDEVTIRAVRTERDFDALQETWDALADEAAVCPFQSFAWLRTWWRHFGEGRPGLRLEILVVSVGDRVTAIAPLYGERLRVLGLLPVTRWAFIGRQLSDYLDVLVAPDAAARSLQALATHLRRRRGAFDVLVLDAMPGFSPTPDGFRQALAAQGMPVDQVVDDACPRVTMAGTWQECEDSLAPALRGKMRRRMKHLTNRHGAELEVVDDPATVPRGLDDLIQMHQKRWTAVGQRGVFADSWYTRFYREAALELSRRGRFHLAFLRLDGHRVAAISGMLHRDEYHFYMGGLGDPGAAARYSPGIALHLLTMQHLHARGVRVYDLLRGTERYKTELGGVVVPTWRVTVAGRPCGLGRWPYLVWQTQSRAIARLDVLRASPGVRGRLLRATLPESRWRAPRF